MASIPEHIKNLLFEQDCVVVPDFGGFITHFHGAVVQDQYGSLLPPRKRVAFNEALKFDDGLLTSYIALKEAISREEVRVKIRVFAEQISRELRLRKSFRFEHLGAFTLNTEGKLVFEPDSRINFFGESYGMTPVAFRSSYRALPLDTVPVVSGDQRRQGILEVVTEEVDAEEAMVLNSRQRWLTLPNVAASTGIVLLSLIGWLWFDGGTTTLSSLNPFAMLKFPEWQKTPSVPARIAKSEPNVVTLPVAEPKATALPAEKLTAPITAGSNAVVATGVEVRPSTSMKTSATSRSVAKNILVIPMRIRTTDGKITTSPGRYFVIAGGFGKEANALRLQDMLKAQGFAQASLLYPVKSRLIRVAAQEFGSVSEARQAAAEARAVLGDHVWVLKTK